MRRNTGEPTAATGPSPTLSDAPSVSPSPRPHRGDQTAEGRGEAYDVALSLTYTAGTSP
jgi:hypothetical protein